MNWSILWPNVSTMKQVLAWLKIFLSDNEDVNEPHYDPVHLGAMVVSTIFSIAALFWLLWSLLVFGGGIQAKLMPGFQLAMRNKVPSDFGYVGYPYEMVMFEGWPTNVTALMILLGLVYALWLLVTKNTDTTERNREA